MTYRTLNHSKFLIHFHIIFVVKYRKPLLIPFGEQIKHILHDIADRSDFSIEEMEVDEDHVHLLIESVPKLSPLQIVRRLKQISTYKIWQLYPEELSLEFTREKTFWSDSYFATSVGQIDKDAVTAYINNQGKDKS